MSPYFLVVSMLAASVALAQTPTDGDASPASKMTDATFLKKLAEGNLAEVKMGELAQKNGDSDGVRSFGQMLQQDHSEANKKAEGVAQSKAVGHQSQPEQE